MQLLITLLIIAVLFAGTTAAVADADTAAADGPDPLRAARTEVYKTVGDTELRLFIFEPTGVEPAQARPAIVFFFGGGWVNGNPRQFAQHCRYFSSRGMVAITAEYRIRSLHGTSPFDAVADAKSAIRYLRANAAKLGIDPDRIAAGGGSAGGHLAAATATVPGLDDAADASVSCVPDALVLFNPVYDNGPDGYGGAHLAKRHAEISPIHNIRPGIPPTIVFLGTKDKLVPVATAERFQSLSREAGGRSELLLFENQPHGFFNFGKDGGTHYRATIAATDRFLASLGFLTGEPTIEQP